MTVTYMQMIVPIISEAGVPARLIRRLQVGGGSYEVRQTRWRWGTGQCSGARQGSGAWLHCWLQGERLLCARPPRLWR